MTIKLLDSSVWIAYFIESNQKAIQLINSSEALLTSAVSLFEVKRKLINHGVPQEKLKISLEFIKQRSMVTDVNGELCEKAADVSLKYNLKSIDSIIYTSSQTNNATLVTCDSDFKNLPNVELL